MTPAILRNNYTKNDRLHVRYVRKGGNPIVESQAFWLTPRRIVVESQ